MEGRLKIFSDRKWLPASCNHVIMLYPFWGDIPLPGADPDAGRFDEYMAKGKEIFEFVNSITDCDVAILPFEFDFLKAELASAISNEVKKANKKLIIFFNNDSFREIKIDNSIVFRTSFFKSRQLSNEFAFPGWSIDFKKYVREIVPLHKDKKPEISYCGYVDSLEEPEQSLLGKIKSLLAPPSKENPEQGSKVRGKAVRRMISDDRFKTNFIIRDGFWAHGITDKHKVRKEYAENMFASPYALVTRGAGNFSYRLYEVMSCGRIPVFINTDSVLPCEKLIDWKKQTVWIEEKEINNIGEIVTEFHSNISETGFNDLQKQNRKIYEQYLSPVGFFNHFKTLVQ